MEGCYLWGANLEGAYLYGANLRWTNLYGANLSYADLEGACLEGTMNFTQTDYNGTPILEGCASGGGGGDCSFEDTDEDGYDDVSYNAGATSGDVNLDAINNVLDVVTLVNQILEN